MQAAIYAVCIGPPLATQCACSESPFTLTSSNFIVGNLYYFVLDGCAGDVCDYSVSATTAPTTPGVTIIDGDNIGLVEGLTTDSYCMVLNSPPTATVTINISPDAQTTVFPSTLVFTPANWDVAQCITVQAIDDAIVEGMHTSTISQSAVSSDPGYNGLVIPDVTANITDNDVPPNSGGPFCEFALFLPNGLDGVTGTLPTVNNPQDFPGCPGSSLSNPSWYSFVAGSNSMTITVTPSNCTGANGFFGMQAAVYDGCGGSALATQCACSEAPFDLSSCNFIVGNTYYIVLDGCASDVCDYTLSTSNALPMPGITILEGDNVDLVEGLVTDSYCMVLESPPCDIVTINIVPDAQTMVFSSPLVFTPANWNVVQCLNVQAVDDAIVEGLHTSAISHSAVSSDPGYNGLSIPDIIADIVDNDALPPPNDDCANANPIACGGTATGTTLGATIDGPAVACGGDPAAPDVWYSFVGTGGSVRATLQSNSPISYSARIDVFTGSCGNLVSIGCYTVFFLPNSEISWISSLGTTYFIRVHGISPDNVGEYTLSIDCYSTIPANNDCADAISVSCGGMVTGTTLGATLNGVNHICGTFTSPDVWYTIVGTGEFITASLCSGTDYDSQISIYSGNCGALYELGYCNNDACGPSGPSEVSWPTVFGLTYFIRVHGYNAVGNFTLNITCEPPTPSLPPDEGSTVACPALAVAPIPPTVNGTCGPITPSVPVITDMPNPLTCEGNRTYAYAYVDCQAGPLGTWTYTYEIEQAAFSITTPNGAATVACPALATPPTAAQLPTVTSNCGEPLSPSAPTIINDPDPITCEGTRTYAYTYTDCEGNTTQWDFVYTIERLPFTLPANGAATVVCPALAIAPTPPTVTSNCGETLTPTGPVITDVPNPFTCEGTRTYAYTFTDCEGNTGTWSFVFTIERNPFTFPINGSSTVACPANATQPTPPTVTSNCGEVLIPTGPVVTNAPNPLTCEGTRTYAYTYTDCEGNTVTWSYVYTIERQPFTVPANGGATVACPAQTDAQPTPPVVTSNCGEMLTPVITASAKPLCEGTRIYTYSYTDCEGNTADWKYIYNVEYNDFTIPASVVNNVECPVNATVPTPPTVTDNCGNALTPVGPTVTSVNNAQGCEGSRKYAYVYKDCEGNSHTWSVTYNFQYSADFFAPADEENYVTCLSYAVTPVPQVLTDFCGQPIKVSGPMVEESIASGGCTGWRKYSYVYTDCGGHSHPWNFTYYINDNEGPLGSCQNSGPVSINVSNLSCIEEVPCPDDYDFSQKIEEMIGNGNYYDVCDGDNISVTLEGSSDPWNCSDPDGNGIYTFGRTFYFRIADACGNEAASLCEVTYSGVCLPLESFSQSDWGIAGDDPGNSVGGTTTDLQVIAALIGNNPIVVGGTQRSLTVDDAQCIVNLLPGTGGPARLGNCHQVNCTGCNPLGIGGMKNSLAANVITLTLNMRYNVLYNGITMNQIRTQSLNCLNVISDIVACAGNDCVLRIFDSAGIKYDFPYTIGGLLDLSNYFLGGNASFTIGQTALYGKALNQSLVNANDYWNKSNVGAMVCDNNNFHHNSGNENVVVAGGDSQRESRLFSIAPNPASNEANFKMSELAESQEVVLELYNSLGQLVLRKDFGFVSFLNEQIDLAGFDCGIYMVNIKSGGNHFVQKLVVCKG